MEKMITWVGTNVPWVGFLLMAIGGGAVAHIRDGEHRKEERSVKEHLIGLVRRTVYATIAGLMWYFLVLQYHNVDQPLSYVGASVVGLFAPEFFDWLWLIFKGKLGPVIGFGIERPSVDPDATAPGLDTLPGVGQKKDKE